MKYWNSSLMQYSEANTQFFSQMFVWQLYPNQGVFAKTSERMIGSVCKLCEYYLPGKWALIDLPHDCCRLSFPCRESLLAGYLWCCQMVGQNVHTEQSVDGHICTLLVKWPMASHYDTHCLYFIKCSGILFYLLYYAFFI